MNETAPLQKQDLDRTNHLLSAMLTVLKAIEAKLPPAPAPPAETPKETK